jgi:tetratricopeptide (TPR) repeat protein
VLYATHGYGCDEARQHSARIADLNAQMLGTPKQFQAQWALMVSTIASSSSRGMPEAATELLRLAKDDPLKQMAAHTLAALASFWLGDFVATRHHDEQAMALYHPQQRHLLVRQFGSDLVVNCASYLACSLYFLGFPAQAQQVCQQMLAQARTLAHPHTLAQALSFAALLQRWLHLPEAALALSAEAITISQQHDFHLWLACGEMTHGWARVKLGQPDGLVEIDASIVGMRSALCGISVVFLSSRIEALLHLKQFEAALVQIAQALAEAQQTGDGHFLAELHRLEGVCLLATQPSDAAISAQAQACFEQALAISRQQHAKSLQLRAATSLAQLHLQRGQPMQARQTLQAATLGFTDGITSHDLVPALVSLPTLQA